MPSRGSDKIGEIGTCLLNRSKHPNEKSCWPPVTNKWTLSFYTLPREQLLCIRPSVEQRSIEPITWPPTTTTRISFPCDSFTYFWNRYGTSWRIRWQMSERWCLSLARNTAFPLRRKTKYTRSSSRSLWTLSLPFCLPVPNSHQFFLNLPHFSPFHFSIKWLLGLIFS